MASSEQPFERTLPTILITLIVIRGLATLSPGMWLWGANSLRFASTPLALLGSTVLVLALARPIATRTATIIDRVEEASRRSGWFSFAGGALLAGGIVWLLPDRTLFTGDFALSQLALQGQSHAAAIMPQSLPLATWLHFAMPQQVASIIGASPMVVARGFSVVEGALLGALGAHLCRRLSLTGAAAVVAFSALVFGGTLAIDAGPEKAFGEIALLGTWIGVWAVSPRRDSTAILGVGLATALALLLHRSALLIVPFVACALAYEWIRITPRPTKAILLASLMIIAAFFVGHDGYSKALAIDRAAGYFGPPAGWRDLLLDALDVGNILLVLSPLSLVVLAGARSRRIPTPLLLCAMVPAVVLLLGTRHSTQGLFRDWDMFAGPLAAFCVLVAATIGSELQQRQALATRWGAGLIAASVVPTLLWMSIQTDPDRGFEQVRAFAFERPIRPPDVRGRTWQFLCSRYVALGRYRDATAAGRNAAALAPTHDLLIVLAGSEKDSGDLRGSRETYRRILDTAPGDLVAWYNVATISAELGDFPAAKDGLEHLAASQASPDVVQYAAALIERERSRIQTR